MTLTIEFGYSKSYNFARAVELARSHPSFTQSGEGKDATYKLVLTDDHLEDFLLFYRLERDEAVS